MTRLISNTQSVPTGRRVSQGAIVLATVAMIVMTADLVVNSPGSAAPILGVAQVALALVCLVAGVVYLFGDRRDAGASSGGPDDVIDLRDGRSVGSHEPTPAPRQIPEARTANGFTR